MRFHPSGVQIFFWSSPYLITVISIVITLVHLFLCRAFTREMQELSFAEEVISLLFLYLMDVRYGKVNVDLYSTLA